MYSLRKQIGAHDGHCWAIEWTVLLRVKNDKANIVLIPRRGYRARSRSVHCHVPTRCKVERLDNRRIDTGMTRPRVDQSSDGNRIRDGLLRGG
jgi:hypothetical protein